MDFSNSIYNYIIKEVYKKYPQIRKSPYTAEYYLQSILHVKNTVHAWHHLRELKIYKGDCTKPIKKDNHWRVIKHKYYLWVKGGIFKSALNKCVKEKYDYVTNYKKLLTDIITEDDVLNLIIDVTKINNLYGSENIAVNNEYTKKNVTALSCISDIYKSPLSVVYLNLSTKPQKSKPKNNPKIKKFDKNRELMIFRLEKKTNDDIEVKKSIFNTKICKINKEYKNTCTSIKNKEESKQQKAKETAMSKKKRDIKNAKKIFENQQIKKNNRYNLQLNKINDEYLLNINKINKKTDKLETYKKKTKIKSFEHETNAIQRALDAILIDVSKYKSINLIGDKGCNTQKKFTLQGKNVNLITPTDKLERMTDVGKKLLRKRSIIENGFADIKKCPRVNLRKDKNIDTYMSFYYLEMMNQYSKYI
jgi:hypothetical protein